MTTSRAWTAPSADFFTVAVISSSAAAVSSRLAACCSVRPRQVVRRRREFLCARPDRFVRCRRPTAWRLQLFDRVVEVVPNLRVSRREAFVQPNHQVAAGEILQTCAETAHGLRLLLGRLRPFRGDAFTLDLGLAAIGQRLCFQPRALHRVLLEHLNRARHVADFIGAGDVSSATSFLPNANAFITALKALRRFTDGT